MPRLNALGRLGSADPGVELLTTDNPGTAQEIAVKATETNTARQQLQQRVVESAGQQARACLAQHPNLELMVLADPSWHHGVVGPAASRIAEQFGRSVILLGRDGAGTWRGSGRSRGRDDLGTLASKLRADGLIERGGGHAAAVGLVVTGQQFEHLQSILPSLSMPRIDGVEPETEILGDVEDLSAPDWHHALDLLAPFGRGNPAPIFTARGCLITASPTNLALRDGTIWASKVQAWTQGGLVASVPWRDPAQARREWRVGGRYDLLLELTCRSYRERLFYNWIVLSSTAAGGVK